MNTRILLVASSLALGATGLVASFAPAEVLVALKAPGAEPLPVLIQVLGALYLAFALANWTAKDSLIGGIYARPLSLANSLHFAMGALALLKYERANAYPRPLLAALIAYAVLALAFGYLVFGKGTACKAA